MSNTEESPDPGSPPQQPSAQQSDGEQGTQPPLLPPIPPEGTAAPPQPDRTYGSAAEGGAAESNRGGTATKARGPTQSPASQDPRTGGAHRLGSQRPGDTGTPPRGPQPLGDDDRRRVLIRGKLALVLGVGALVFSVPLFPLGLALGVGAIVLGVTAGRIGRGAGFAVPGSKPGIVLGAVATFIAGLVTAAALIFYDELTEWQDCLSGANTRSGEQICQEEFSERVTERLNEFGFDVTLF